MAEVRTRRGWWWAAWLSCAVALSGTIAAAPPAGSDLGPGTLAGWRAYMDAVERRRAGEGRVGPSFLVLDVDRDATEERRVLMSGAIRVQPMAPELDHGRPIDVPGGLVHHWQGAVLLRGVSVGDLLTAIEHADPPAVQDDVLASAVLSRQPGRVHVFLRLRRQKIVTAVYDTEHDVTFERAGPTRAESISRSTKIAEVYAPGTPEERELPRGKDRGFLWRLNAYWRYEAVPGGVIAECESISLSRSVPFGLGAVVGPLVASTARESMTAALVALRRRFSR